MAAEPVAASVFVAAPPERVYKYFTQPAEIVRWMGDYALLDAKPNGLFTLDVRGAPVRGRYLELEAPSRLLISWGYAESERVPPGASIVEVRLVAERGGTRVEVEHRKLPPEETQPHTRGWDHYLARLQHAATSGDAGLDPGMPS
ncbi:MAG: SRPBCC domain-containing protein [Solirubrobacterales bacterium]|nr:SRPBCC domain-containing protein [Solirubrobacterales bacterium]